MSSPRTQRTQQIDRGARLKLGLKLVNDRVVCMTRFRGLPQQPADLLSAGAGLLGE